MIRNSIVECLGKKTNPGLRESFDNAGQSSEKMGRLMDGIAV
jgi:hypothetical protein